MLIDVSSESTSIIRLPFNTKFDDTSKNKSDIIKMVSMKHVNLFFA